MKRKRKKGHKGFWISDGETSMHVLGDPDMSEETKKAFLEIAKAYQSNPEIAEDTPKPDESDNDE